MSDAMRSLSRTGAIPECGGKRDIDSVVGVWQALPAASNIETPPHVTVLGYSDLLDRLTTPGPVVDWTDDG